MGIFNYAHQSFQVTNVTSVQKLTFQAGGCGKPKNLSSVYSFPRISELIAYTKMLETIWRLYEQIIQFTRCTQIFDICRNNNKIPLIVCANPGKDRNGVFAKILPVKAFSYLCLKGQKCDCAFVTSYASSEHVFQTRGCSAK